MEFLLSQAESLGVHTTRTYTVSAFPRNLPRKSVVQAGGRQGEEVERKPRGKKKGKGRGRERKKGGTRLRKGKWKREKFSFSFWWK